MGGALDMMMEKVSEGNRVLNRKTESKIRRSGGRGVYAYPGVLFVSVANNGLREKRVTKNEEK